MVIYNPPQAKPDKEALMQIASKQGIQLQPILYLHQYMLELSSFTHDQWQAK